MFSAATVDQEEQGSAGPRFRAPVPGDETDFVQTFLQEALPLAARNLRRSVFIEPRIDGGFPDVVAVYWDERVATGWPCARTHLIKADLKALHGFYLRGCVETGELEQRHGRAAIRATLDRLVAGGLLRRLREGYKLRSLESAFAVRRLIAIEAKVGDYQRGLMQAIQNIWFASDSYLLVRGRPRDPATFELAQRAGVRIVGVQDTIDTMPLEPNSERLPRSYCSWLFNEWTWRLRGDADARMPLPTSLARRSVP